MNAIVAVAAVAVQSLKLKVLGSRFNVAKPETRNPKQLLHDNGTIV
jgi:hypothetical protein